MTKPMHVSAAEAHERLTSGKALLVCAYRDEESCKNIQLEGSISLARLESKRPGPPKDREIIFYCA